MKFGEEVSGLTRTNDAPHLDVPYEIELTWHSSTPLVKLAMVENTHASRNPSRAIIPPRKHAKKQLTDAQQRANSLKRAANREKAERLQKAVQLLHEQQAAGIKAAAEDIGYTVEYVEKLVNRTDTLKLGKRGPSIHNAHISALAQEENEGTYHLAHC